jgi:hypothetical protein
MAMTEHGGRAGGARWWTSPAGGLLRVAAVWSRLEFRVCRGKAAVRSSDDASAYRRFRGGGGRITVTLEVMELLDGAWGKISEDEM